MVAPRFNLKDWPEIFSRGETAALTRQERAVLIGILSGLSQKEIAKTLCVLTDTVKVHCMNLYRKLGFELREGRRGILRWYVRIAREAKVK